MSLPTQDALPRRPHTPWRPSTLHNRPGRMASICRSSLTRDGELVVLGQADLSQLTERNDPVSQLTLSEVQGLDAGYRFDPAGDGTFPWRGKGQRVLSLQEILSLFPEELIVVKVEEPGFASLAALLQAADATGSRTRLLAIVDEQQLANTLRSQASDLATANTSAEAAAFLATQRLRMTPFYRPAAPGLILDGDQVSRRLSNSAHSRGIQRAGAGRWPVQRRCRPMVGCRRRRRHRIGPSDDPHLVVSRPAVTPVRGLAAHKRLEEEKCLLRTS